jgi:hypothetical protein
VIPSAQTQPVIPSAQTQPAVPSTQPQPVPSTQPMPILSRRNREIVRLETDMLKLIDYYMNIIKKNPALNYSFNALLSTSQLGPTEIEMLNTYKIIGVRDEVASLITIFYSILGKMSLPNQFIG